MHNGGGGVRILLTVNIASRMESSGNARQVNISQSLFTVIQGHPQFAFGYRGAHEVKDAGSMEMWYVRAKNSLDSV